MASLRTAMKFAKSVKPLRQSVRMMAAVQNFKPPTMDEIPIPQGSWSEQQKKRDTFNNLVLLGGIAWMAFSIIAFLNTPGVDFVLPPKDPAPRK
ncbi:unnamed protein product [Notodromas monacha]|uniref:Deltamethrin resistance protein prag01 domain-containing protein n=1 Tax=Notodromas monacha TaxID=399045 RepID=A0A7R9BJW0_9CRUS|nr:unnamed protein product [Notodromas monacha]CAG0915726.1 unnamed protein product [Notodromas monacha]